MPHIVDGKKLAADVLAHVRQDVLTLKKKPKLIAILVGDDPASVSYLGEKRKKCEEAGVAFELHQFPEKMTTTKLRSRIASIRKEKKPTAMIVQLPLPAHINAQYILDAIPPEEDVDVLSSRAKGLFASGKSKIIPPTAAAVIHILESCNVQLATCNVALVGIGSLVGKPLMTLLADKAASLTVVRSKTENMAYFTQKADVLITGVGKPNLITGEMVKEGVVAIDAGYAKLDGNVCGDLDFDSVSKKASIITPVPGGIGPLTVAFLIKNVLILAMAADWRGRQKREQLRTINTDKVEFMYADERIFSAYVRVHYFPRMSATAMQHYVTPQGLDDLKAELEELKKKRQEIAKSIEEAKQLGDLSENASYTEALDSQSFNEGRIAELEELIRNAAIINKQFTETVELGATVEAENGNGERKTFIIVGSQEADPAQGKISNVSPVGRAFLSKHKNEIVEVKTPKGVVQYKIVSIK